MSEDTSASSAEWYCAKCERSVDAAEAQGIQAGNLTVYVCPRCGDRLRRSRGGGIVADGRSPMRVLAGNVASPFAGAGKVQMFVGTVILAGFHLLTMALSLFPLVSFFFMMGLYGYLVLWAFRNMAAASDGEEGPADWPDPAGGLGELFGAFWKAVVVGVISFGPLLAYVFFRAGTGAGSDAAAEGTLQTGPIFYALAGLGFFLVPLLAIQVGLTGSVHPAGLLLAPKIIGKAPGPYAFIVGQLVASKLLLDGLDALSARVPVPGVALIAGSFLELYLLVVNARAFGLFYRLLQERPAE